MHCRLVVFFFAVLLLSCEQGELVQSNESPGVPSAAPTPLLVATEVTLDGTADTYVREWLPIFGFGSRSYLHVAGSVIDGWSNALVRVDTSDIVSSVAPGAQVERAYLELTVRSVGAGWGEASIGVHAMTKSWSESGATWLCASQRFFGLCRSSDVWGMDWWNIFAPTPFEEFALDEAELSDADPGDVVRLDVTSYVNRVLADPDLNHGWVIKSSQSFDFFVVDFESRESGTPPRLVIESRPLAVAGEECSTDWHCESGLICGALNGEAVCTEVHCGNGVMDPGEAGLDCGGGCEPCPTGTVCGPFCELGDDILPVPSAVLSFSDGAFSRPTFASYQWGDGRLVTSRPDFIRFENRGDGAGRVALFEGERTNYMHWAGEYGHEDAWGQLSLAGVPYFDGTDASILTAPDGRVDARSLTAVSGAQSLAQSISGAPSAATVSVWQRLGLGESPWIEYQTRLLGAGGLLGEAVTDASVWSLDSRWTRYSKAISPSGDTRVFLSHAGGWPTGSELELPDVTFLAWGFQLEEGAFPSSYIDTETEKNTRAADLLTFASADVPSWIRSGTWQVDVYPLFASTEVQSGDSFVLLSFGSSANEVLLTTVGAAAGLKVRAGGTTRLTTPLTWERNQKLTITLDVTGAEVTVRGATTGDGTFGVSAFTFSGSPLRVGGRYGSDLEAFSRISEPREVPYAFSTCQPDPDRCSPDCPCGPGDGHCDGDSECQSGSACKRFGGWSERYGFPETYAVCVLTGCEKMRGGIFTCGTTDSPCGECPTCGLGLPDCSQKSCGSDGCWGSCGDQCESGEAGCRDNRDCEGELVCQRYAGARFGLTGFSAGSNVCVPPVCDSLDRQSYPCGTTSSPCGLCDACTPQCAAGNACGDDGCGGSCGSCSTGEYCSVGQCASRLVSNPPGWRFEPSSPEWSDVADHTTPEGVGGSPGSVGVDHSGNARYVVPLELPPGRAGLRPGLSLSYTSGGVDGYLGSGWSLNGLSSIVRCNRTVAQDGEAAAVDFSSEDRFCLDGNRLVLVSGNYGDGGSEYRTESEEYLKIVAHGDPVTSFSVWQKGGHVLTYGGTADSLIAREVLDLQAEIFESDIHAWSVSNVRDRLGNYIAIRYENEGEMTSLGWAREQRPLEIAYTGSEVLFGLAPSRFVRFVYQDAADSRAGFRSGALVFRSKLLDRIDILVQDQVVRAYDFAYTEPADPRAGPTVPVAILDSVTECAPTSGTDPALACKLPTTFEYEVPGFGWDAPEKPVGFVDEDGDFVNYKFPDITRDGFQSAMTVGDLNGNGIDDLVFHWREVNSTGTWGVILDGKTQLDTGIYVNASPYFLEAGQSQDARECGGWWAFDKNNCSDLKGEDNGLLVTGQEGQSRFAVIDFDNDGDDDILEFASVGGEGQLRVISFDSDTGEFSSSDTGLGTRTTLLTAIDVDGDGLKDLLDCDLVWKDKSVWQVRFNDPNGTFTDWQVVDMSGDSSVQPTCKSSTYSLVVDLDGDGVDEFVIPEGKANYEVFDFHGSRAELSVVRHATSLSAVQLVPFGTGTRYRRIQPTVLDFNGDGLPDFMQFYHGEDIVVHLNRGTFDHDGWQFTAVTMPWPTSLGGPDSGPHPALIFSQQISNSVVVDVDGDGREDYVTPTGLLGTEAMLWRSTGASFQFEPLRDLAREETRRNLWSARLVAYDADGDGQRDLGYLDHETTEVWTLQKRKGSARVRLTNIRSGSGSEIELSYAHLTDPAVYTHGDGGAPRCTATQRCAVPRQAVVSEHRVFYTDSTSPNEHFSYTYEDARWGLDGRGWLGFAKRDITDVKQSEGTFVPTVRMLTLDNQTHEPITGSYPLAGIVKGEVDVQAVGQSGYVQTSTTNTFSVVVTDNNTVDAQVSASVLTVESALNITGPLELLSTRESGWTYDDFRNVTHSTVEWSGPSFAAESLQTAIDYWHTSDTDYVDAWLVDLAERRTVAPLSGPGKVSEYTPYDKAASLGMTGLYETVTIEPSEPDLRTITQLTHDVFGNPHTVMVSGQGEPTRQTEILYDPEGLYPEFVITDGHQVEVEYHPALGTLVGVRQEVVPGAAPLISRWYYDYFGRLREQVGPNGISSLTAYQEVPNQGTVVTTTGTGQPTVTLTYDAAQREVQREVDGLVGQLRVDTHYDGFGLVDRVSRPYRDGTAVHETKMVYDQLGRVRGIEAPDGTSRETCYWAGAACQVDEALRVKCVVKDARGRAVRSYDQPPASVAAGGLPCQDYAELAWLDTPASDWRATTFEYDIWGSLERLVDKDSNATIYTNDRYGRPTLVDDPDTGAHGYVYSPFGTVRQHTDANGSVTTYKYDTSRRMIERRHVDAGGAGVDAVSTWHWDSGAVGNLDSTVSPDGIQVDYAYDDLARLEATTWDYGASAYAMQYSYDSVGRLQTITYPETAFEVEYAYTGNGHLSAVYDTRDMSDPLWSVVSMSDDGQLAEQTLGHVATTYGVDLQTGRLESIQAEGPSGASVLDLDYTYHPTGELLTRSNGGDSEEFSYDALGRLRTSVRNSNSPSTRHYTGIGNIEHLDDAAGSSTVYHYETGRTHAATRVVRGADEDQYLYDGNGSVLSRTGTLLGDLTIEYTRANKPRRIFSASDESDAIDLLYDAELNRVRKTGAMKTKTYVPGLFYESVNNDGIGPRELHYQVSVAGSMIAELVRLDDGTTTDEHMLFFHGDRLGSMRRATDVDGVELQSADFEAFGGVRAASVDPSTPGTHVSYTGHETDGEFGLLNMGGRIYDPGLQRFLSADPFISSPYNSQSLNRYSYTLNNPLRYTDPTGFAGCDIQEGCVRSPGGGAGGNIGGGGGGGGGGGDAVDQLSEAAIPGPGASVAVGAVPWSPNDTNTSILDTPLGTGGKVAVVTSGAVAGAVVGAGFGWGMAYASSLACGPAAGICAGVVTVGFVGYGGYSLVNGGWDAMSSSFSRVFSSEEASVGDALTVGSTLGAVASMGPLAAARGRSFLGSAATKGLARRAVIKARVLNARVSKGLSKGANFAQRTFREGFSQKGKAVLSEAAGRPIRTMGDLVGAIRGGLNPAKIPVHYIVRDGKTLILNTRTALALERAGVPRSAWNAVNQTGNEVMEGLLSGQLGRNMLGSEGIPFVILQP